MAEISPIYGSANPADYVGVSTGTTRVPVQSLGQQEFLKLLVTKMTSQDPMNPQADTEFIAQMAQFSTLEQSKSMQADIASLRTQQQVLTANGLIGRTVTVNDGTPHQGVVQSIAFRGGEPMVVVGGANYGLGDVTLISPFVETPTTLPTA